MPAYIISQVHMRPGPALDSYRRLAADSIERHGGKYLVRGGKTDVLEGEWAGAVIVVEFPSVEQARAWYESDDYADALKFRHDALTRNLILVEGV
jgi:uncharacterized protein (DUF1330 family)